MKKFFVLFLTIFMFYACSNKELSPLEKRIEKHIVFEEIDQGLVKDFNYKTNSNNLLEIELVLRSTKDIDLSYKISWKDEDGFRLKTYQDGEYKPVKLKAGKELVLKRVASDNRAKDFSIILKEE